MNEAAELALDDAKATLDRYGEIVSEVHRRFALLSWRGTLDGTDDGFSEPIAQRAIGTYLAHAAALAEIATKLQLECETIFTRSALDSSERIEPHAHNRPSSEDAR